MLAPLIMDTVMAGSAGDSVSQTKVASTALYVLMQRSVVPGCPLSGNGNHAVCSRTIGQSPATCHAVCDLFGAYT